MQGFGWSEGLQAQPGGLQLLGSVCLPLALRHGAGGAFPFSLRKLCWSPSFKAITGSVTLCSVANVH